MKPCQNAAVVDLQDAGLSDLGRTVYLNVTLKQICPGRRVAAALFLTELCPGGGEQFRGVKYLTIPAHHGPGCQDVVLRCVPFILPECACCGSLCRKRWFNARVMANYLDSDLSWPCGQSPCC